MNAKAGAIVAEQEENQMTVVQRAELDVQISTAKAYPRVARKCLDNAVMIATMNKEIAESCIYSLPRSNKDITGPSVRLAEIVMSEWGNIHAGYRVLHADQKHVHSEAVVWDLEKNNRITAQVARKILDKDGKRYSEDMVTTTGSAGSSIALRNALFRIIPKSITETVLLAVKDYLKGGTSKQMQEKITIGLAWLAKAGLPENEVLKLLGKQEVSDLDGDDYLYLLGIKNSLVDGFLTKEQILGNEPIDGEDEGMTKGDQIMSKLKKRGKK